MRHSRNIFEADSYGGTGRYAGSGAQILTIVLSVISLSAAIFIIVNFNAVTVKIARGAARFLTAGFPAVILITVAAVLIGRWRWRMRRRFWGW